MAGFRLAGASAPAQPLPACYAATRPFRVELLVSVFCPEEKKTMSGAAAALR